MRVGVDARALAGQRGVGRYARSLVAALVDRFPELEFHGLRHRGEAVDVGAATTLHGTPWPRRPAYAAGALVGRPRLDRMLGVPLDLVWLPAPVPVAISPALPLVLTVHDLSFEERRRDFTAYERVWHRAARPGRLLHRADRILVDSVVTRGEVLSRHGLGDDRVDVVHPGVTVVSPDATASGRRTPFFLWVGALEPRKAPDVLARAYADARHRGLDAELVVVGEGRAPLTGTGVVHLGRVDDGTLAALYRDALALVMPSRLEGFGFPPLEAAAHGTPAIVSDLPVFGETLGDAAVRVPVDDVAALADALLRVARDPALARDHGERAAAAVAAMTWARAAELTHRAFVRAIAGAGAP